MSSCDVPSNRSPSVAAFVSLEAALLLDRHPRQLAPLLRERIAHRRVPLLACAQRLVSDQPLIPTCHSVISRALLHPNIGSGSLDAARPSRTLLGRTTTGRSIPVRRKAEIGAGQRYCCFRQRTAH